MRKGLLLLACCATLTLQAQDALKLKFRSRALLDASVASFQDQKAQGYYRLEDFRVGFKAGYKNLEMKADIGLGGGKVAIKDLLLQATWGSHTLALGNAYDPFSMDMLISTADLRFHQSATSVLAFTDSRKLGATWHFQKPAFYLASGIYTYNDINKIGENQRNSLVSTSRAVWRRQRANDHLLHFGGVFSFRTAPVNQKDYNKELSAAGVTSMFSEPLLTVGIGAPRKEFKGVLEALITGPRYLLQGEYYLNRYCLSGDRNYQPHGGYAQASYLLLGRGFSYDAASAVPGRPASDRALELTARFNYTNMNDTGAGILGGEEKDLSVGLNFYLNAYIGFKISGSYVWVGEHCNPAYKNNYFVPQARVQYIF